MWLESRDNSTEEALPHGLYILSRRELNILIFSESLLVVKSKMIKRQKLSLCISNAHVHRGIARVKSQNIITQPHSGTPSQVFFSLNVQLSCGWQGKCDIDNTCDNGLLLLAIQQSCDLK